MVPPMVRRSTLLSWAKPTKPLIRQSQPEPVTKFLSTFLAAKTKQVTVLTPKKKIVCGTEKTGLCSKRLKNFDQNDQNIWLYRFSRSPLPPFFNDSCFWDNYQNRLRQTTCRLSIQIFINCINYLILFCYVKRTWICTLNFNVLLLVDIKLC